MLSKPLVTIITPTYNRADYLNETIKSILNQSYKNIEYIVVDDGSTDNTRDLVKNNKKKITYIYQKNSGETAAVNTGLSRAKGDIVTIVNSDDPLLPGAIAEAVAFFEKKPYVLFAYPDFVLIDEKGRRVKKIQVPEYDYSYMFAAHHCLPGPGTFIQKAGIKYVPTRDKKFKYVGDFFYWLRLGCFGLGARIPKTLATFRTHSGSQSLYAKGELMAREHLTLVERILSYPYFPAYAKSLKNKAYSSACFHAGSCSDNFIDRLSYLYLSFKYHPFTFLQKYKYELVKLKAYIKNKLK
jgi:glycosyltransferase involved in cell wall biosynthesis